MEDDPNQQKGGDAARRSTSLGESCSDKQTRANGGTPTRNEKMLDYSDNSDDENMGIVEDFKEGDEGINPPPEKEKRTDARKFAMGNNLPSGENNKSQGVWGTPKTTTSKSKVQQSRNT